MFINNPVIRGAIFHCHHLTYKSYIQFVFIVSRVSRVCTVVQHTVVRAIAVSYGRPRNLTLARSKALGPIGIKFCTVDYVGETSGCAKKHNNRLHGAPPYIREI